MTALAEAVQRPRQDHFITRLARTPAEVRETQRLRYRVFAEELGAEIDGGREGVDRDELDEHCLHLTVTERDSGRVIASTRLLTDERAVRAGGFYSANEFDIGMIQALPGRSIEIGRTCVDPEFRSGTVIALLWQGIAEHVTANGFHYLFGCASISLADAGRSARIIMKGLRERHFSPGWERVWPYIPLPEGAEPPGGTARMPPLLRAYLSLGAHACGEAYYDHRFHCADVFMLLKVDELASRYSRHFGERRLLVD